MTLRPKDAEAKHNSKELFYFKQNLSRFQAKKVSKVPFLQHFEDVKRHLSYSLNRNISVEDDEGFHMPKELVALRNKVRLELKENEASIDVPHFSIVEVNQLVNSHNSSHASPGGSKNGKAGSIERVDRKK